MRQNGYALDDEENEKGRPLHRSLPARLPERGKNTRFGGISGPTSRMTRERVKELAVDVKKYRKNCRESLVITNLKIEFSK